MSDEPGRAPDAGAATVGHAAPAPSGDVVPDESRPRGESGATSAVRPRSEVEIRWRQARNAPPPVVRAVLANVALASIGGVVLLFIDWLAHTGVLPMQLAALAFPVYVLLVVVAGSVLTYLWVELPTGRPGEHRRSGWAAILGFFASVPIVYLTLVLLFQVIRPLLP